MVEVRRISTQKIVISEAGRYLIDCGRIKYFRSYMRPEILIGKKLYVTVNSLESAFDGGSIDIVLQQPIKQIVWSMLIMTQGDKLIFYPQTASCAALGTAPNR